MPPAHVEASTGCVGEPPTAGDTSNIVGPQRELATTVLLPHYRHVLEKSSVHLRHASQEFVSKILVVECVAASDQSQQSHEASALCDLLLYMYSRFMKYMTCFPYCEITYSTNSWRPCGDYRHLNSITVADRCPVLHIHSFSHKVNSCTRFSKIDLKKVYCHVPVAEKDIKKTTVTTPLGLFEILKMPFGLRNSAQ